MKEKLLLLKDPAYRAQLGGAGAARILERYSWDGISSRYVALLEKANKGGLDCE